MYSRSGTMMSQWSVERQLPPRAPPRPSASPRKPTRYFAVPYFRISTWTSPWRRTTLTPTSPAA
jgi:hypothetical protein